jgi:hypothetical protein
MHDWRKRVKRLDRLVIRSRRAVVGSTGKPQNSMGLPIALVLGADSREGSKRIAALKIA